MRAGGVTAELARSALEHVPAGLLLPDTTHQVQAVCERGPSMPRCKEERWGEL